MTIDLANILDRKFSQNTLEMVFQSIKISQFFWGEHGATLPKLLFVPLAVA